MSFVSPLFLFALLAIAIPILIHLFNFRKYKKIYFSNVAFLESLKKQTDKQSKLKNLLVLFARILAIVFLVLAFSQPFIPVTDQVKPNNTLVSVFVDNSFSMDAVGKEGVLLNQAKRTAAEIANFYKSTDQFQLLTNDFKGRQQRLVNKDEFLELLDVVEISSASKPLSDILIRQSEAVKQESFKGAAVGKELYVISDFQKNNFNTNQFKQDSTVNVTLVPLESATRSNVYIDSCWFETPIQQFGALCKLHVRVQNKSSEDISDNSIKLFINNKQKTPNSFAVSKGGSTEVVFSFSVAEADQLESAKTTHNSYIQNGRVELSDHPVTFDDKFYFNFEIAKNTSILVINGEESSLSERLLAKLFDKDSLFVFNSLSQKQLDYSRLLDYNCIVLNELKEVSSGLSLELNKFIKNGGHVLIFPSADIDLMSYQRFLQSINANYYQALDTLSTKVDAINLLHPIYADAFEKDKKQIPNLNLPSVNQYYVLSKLTRNTQEDLLKLQNGNAFLTRQSIGSGAIYLSAVPLNSVYSNFHKHAIFVPTLFNIALQSNYSKGIYHIIGKNELIPLSVSVLSGTPYHIKSKNEELDFIAEARIVNGKANLLDNNTITEAGNYSISTNGALLGATAFNYNGRESNLDCYSASELDALLTDESFLNFKLLEQTNKSVQETLAEVGKGKALWKMCLIFALLFLAVEVALLRFMK